MAGFFYVNYFHFYLLCFKPHIKHLQTDIYERPRVLRKTKYHFFFPGGL